MPAPGSEGPPPFADADPETAAAFAICMNAINFGSGWWPTIRERPGHSGYATGVTECFTGEGPWSVEELQAMDAERIAAVVGQEPEHPLCHSSPPRWATSETTSGASTTLASSD